MHSLARRGVWHRRSTRRCRWSSSSGVGGRLGVGGLRVALRVLYSVEPCFSNGVATFNSLLGGAQERREKRRLQHQQTATGGRDDARTRH